jgi:hypothetical protein
MNDTSPINSEIQKRKQLISERLKLFVDYRRTRSAIKSGVGIYSLSDSELSSQGYLGPWKFNLTEVAIAGGISLAVIKFFSALNLSIPSATGEAEPASSEFELMLSTAWSWFEPFFIPLFFTAFVYMTAWSSLEKSDASKEKKTTARKAFLYFDGAYGILPQTMLPLLSALSASTFLQQLETDDALATLPLTVQLLILAFMMWQLIIMGNIIPKSLFSVNGYTNRARRFWQKKLSTDPPWGKYILSNTFLAPILGVGVFLVLIALASVVAYILLMIRSIFT